MSLKLQICIAVLVLVMMFLIANMVRKKKIDLRYALGWLCLGAIVLILDAFPSILNNMAKILGVALPSNMVFMVGIIFLVVAIYMLTASVSRLSNKNKRLTQEMALLREELERMKGQND